MSLEHLLAVQGYPEAHACQAFPALMHDKPGHAMVLCCSYLLPGILCMACLQKQSAQLCIPRPWSSLHSLNLPVSAIGVWDALADTERVVTQAWRYSMDKCTLIGNVSTTLQALEEASSDGVRLQLSGGKVICPMQCMCAIDKI